MESSRKPPQRASNASRKPRLPLPAVRARIWAAAVEMVADGSSEAIISVLANRFHTSHRIIELVLIVEGARHERVAAAFRTGIISTMANAREIGATFVEDIENVA